MAHDLATSTFHIFCTGVTGRTVTVPVSSSTGGADLRQLLQGLLHVPACEQVLVHQGRSLSDGVTLASAGVCRDSTVHVHLRLCGGKGGFGALLRGQGRDGKITDNYDACRDLSGRRLRHVEAEKKLKSWQAEAKERELEKLALQHMKQMAKEAKRQKEHQVTEEEVKQQQRDAVAAVQDAINEAMAAADSGDSSQSAGAAAAEGAAEGPTAAAAAAAGAGPGVGSKRPTPAAGAAAAANKRRKGMMQALDELSSEDDSSSDDADDA